MADFENVRSRLFGIAYQVLGRASDAEDAVQDVWIRWQRWTRPGCAIALVEHRPEFRHPLIRSAVYKRATVTERITIHRVLAAAFDDVPERGLAHLAAATFGPDDELATRLEQFADESQARGKVAAAVPALSRAAGLVSDTRRRTRVLVRAAQLSGDLNDRHNARMLLDRADMRVRAISRHGRRRCPVLTTKLALILKGWKMLQIPSFEADIRPLFRDKDRDSMLGHFDLWSFDEVRRNAERIYGALAAEAMPCDAPWPQAHKDLLRRWIDGGTQP